MAAPEKDPIELRLRWLDDAGWALFEERDGVTAGVPFYLDAGFGRGATVNAIIIEVRALMSMTRTGAKYTLEIEQ